MANGGNDWIFAGSICSQFLTPNFTAFSPGFIVAFLLKF